MEMSMGDHSAAATTAGARMLAAGFLGDPRLANACGCICYAEKAAPGQEPYSS